MNKKQEIRQIEGVRKVRWDALWHALYAIGGRETWDRVSRKEAMAILRKLK